MAEYTPTVAWAARMYAFGSVTDGAGIEISDVEVSKRAEFDRMIAGVERAAAVKALREAASLMLFRNYDRVLSVGVEHAAGVLRAEADRIESEGQE